MPKKRCLAALFLGMLTCTVIASPDEDKLGKAQGYPVGNAKNLFFDEAVRVGSFTAYADIPNLFNGKANVLAPIIIPMLLPKAERETSIRWDVDQLKNLNVDDYLTRQRIMGLLIIKDGVIQVERYQ